MRGEVGIAGLVDGDDVWFADGCGGGRGITALVEFDFMRGFEHDLAKVAVGAKVFDADQALS